MGLRFTLEMECGNEAFTCDGAESVAFATVEVGRILAELAPKLERDGRNSGSLSDVNGNRVGSYKFVGGVSRNGQRGKRRRA